MATLLHADFRATFRWQFIKQFLSDLFRHERCVFTFVSDAPTPSSHFESGIFLKTNRREAGRDGGDGRHPEGP